MKQFYQRPEVSAVTMNDSFWTPYREGIRDVMIPYCFEKFEEIKYLQNFRSVAAKDGEKHVGPPFSDGLVLETITGLATFLEAEYNKKMDETLDDMIALVLSAQQEDGFLCTQTCQDYPEKRWGENDGEMVFQHDLYNQGALVEAGIAHYKATGKTVLLQAAVKSANLVCSYIGEAPKKNYIPGHSLPEMAFINLYKLFRDTRELDAFAQENGVKIDEYLEVVRFWYDSRGNHEGRNMSKIPRFTPEYNQDAMPFAKMRSAMGHAVRAGLCYAGAAMAARELNREDYDIALAAIWEDVVKKKLHINGGIGSNHDIEGFDGEYQLPNDAYLETCAGIAFAFWAGEMSLSDRKATYFDFFELSLYNNVLGAVGEDFISYYYDNALVNDGTKNRWNWHECPCCPPMLSKMHSSLPSYIYSYNQEELCVHLYIDSSFETDAFAVSQKEQNIKVNVKADSLTLSLRIPAYAEGFTVTADGKGVDYQVDQGYAQIQLAKGETELAVTYQEKLIEICANTNVEADLGRTCVMHGKYLMCAEGADNGGDVDFTLAENPELRLEGEQVKAKTADGKEVTLIPYYKRNNRVSENTNDSKMVVWFPRQGMADKAGVDKITGDNLYGYYQKY